MIVRFQADADLNFLIVRKLLRREPEIDFQSATKAGLAGQSDPEVLALAAREGRILVSHDETKMPRHFGNFIRKEHSAGVVILSQALPHSVVVEELELIWGASEAEEWVNRITYLPL
ncbi:MAG: DUF5615 family PIN-like protein [Gammaproteobacteria bacterium]